MTNALGRGTAPRGRLGKRADVTAWAVSATKCSKTAGRIQFVGMFCDRSKQMLGVALSAIWDIISYNDFQIPRWAFGELRDLLGSTGSA